MEHYTRHTVFGPVTGVHADLVDAAAAAVDRLAPKSVVNLTELRRVRRPRVGDLVAALSLDYDRLPATGS